MDQSYSLRKNMYNEFFYNRIIKIKLKLYIKTMPNGNSTTSKTISVLIVSFQFYLIICIIIVVFFSFFSYYSFHFSSVFFSPFCFSNSFKCQIQMTVKCKLKCKPTHTHTLRFCLYCFFLCLLI